MGSLTLRVTSLRFLMTTLFLNRVISRTLSIVLSDTTRLTESVGTSRTRFNGGRPMDDPVNRFQSSAPENGSVEKTIAGDCVSYWDSLVRCRPAGCRLPAMAAP